MVLTFFLSFLCIEAKLETQKKSVCSCTPDLCNLCVKHKRGDATQDHTITVPHNDNGDSDKKYISYEETSIYEWIHNLYLFEESINKKKKQATCVLGNGNCSSFIDGGNEQDSLCQGRGISDLNEMGEWARNEPAQKRDQSKRECLDIEKNTIKTPVEGESEDRGEGGGRDVIETKVAEMVRQGGRKDSIQFVEMDELNNYGKDANNSKGAKSHDNNDNRTSGKVYSYEGTTQTSNSLRRETKNGVKEMEKQKGEGNEETQNKIKQKTPDSLRGSVKDSTCHYNNSLAEDAKNAGEKVKAGLNKQVYLLSSHDNAMFYGYIYKEPEGNIGKYFRMIIKNYYVPLLSSPMGKIVVYILFTIIIGVALYGCTLIKKGIKFNSAFPTDSYIRKFNSGMEKNFPSHWNIVEVCFFDETFLNKYKKLMGSDQQNLSFIFYPENTNDLNEEQKKLNTGIAWEKKEIHDALKKMNNEFRKLGFVSNMHNGFEAFLETYGDDYADDSSGFHETLGQWLQTHADGIYFKNDFVILNEQVVAWRFFYYQQNTDDTERLGMWLKVCQEKSFLKDHNIKMACFHFSSIFIEADEAIIEVTAKHLGITIITVLIVTAYIVKGLYSCLIITIIIFLIDLCIFGFMCLCKITINIISMVILVLSVGFCIDHTSHIIQAFMHSHGRTRNEKMKESLHLMVGPVVHSGLSTWFVISTLFFSNKDFTVIFFQTLSLVLFFSIIFSSIFLPVLLSSIGPL